MLLIKSSRVVEFAVISPITTISVSLYPVNFVSVNSLLNVSIVESELSKMLIRSPIVFINPPYNIFYSLR